MAVITLPPQFFPRTSILEMTVSQRVGASPFGGSEQAVDLLNDRWVMSCEIPPCSTTDGGWIEAFIGKLRGQTNTVNVYHFKRPAPVGTIRGTLALSAGASQGASSITVSGCVPTTGTFKAGDMLGVSGLLLRVADDCTAVAGVVTAPLTNAVRKALSSGAAVTWDKPTTEMRLLSTSGVKYAPGYVEAVSFDFGEKI